MALVSSPPFTPPPPSLLPSVGGELASVLEERLYALASSLPRLMRQHGRHYIIETVHFLWIYLSLHHSPDDAQKVSTLQLLAGFLQLLGPHTLTLTHSHAHLSRITQALIQVTHKKGNDSSYNLPPPDIGGGSK